MVAVAEPDSGPTQYTQWYVQMPDHKAGPNSLAGFKTAPVRGPPEILNPATTNPNLRGIESCRCSLAGSQKEQHIRTSIAVSINSTPTSWNPDNAGCCSGRQIPLPCISTGAKIMRIPYPMMAPRICAKRKAIPKGIEERPHITVASATAGLIYAPDIWPNICMMVVAAKPNPSGMYRSDNWGTSTVGMHDMQPNTTSKHVQNPSDTIALQLAEHQATTGTVVSFCSCDATLISSMFITT